MLFPKEKTGTGTRTRIDILVITAAVKFPQGENHNLIGVYKIYQVEKNLRMEVCKKLLEVKFFVWKFAGKSDMSRALPEDVAFGISRQRLAGEPEYCFLPLEMVY